MSTPSLLEIVDQFDQKLFEYLKQLRSPSVWKNSYRPVYPHYVPLAAAQNILKMTIEKIPEYRDIDPAIELILVEGAIVTDTPDFVTSYASGKVIYKGDQMVALKVSHKKGLVNLEAFIHEYGHVYAHRYQSFDAVYKKITFSLAYSEFCAIWLERQASKIEPSIFWQIYEWTWNDMSAMEKLMRSINTAEQMKKDEEMLGWEIDRKYVMAKGLIEWWGL